MQTSIHDPQAVAAIETAPPLIPAGGQGVKIWTSVHPTLYAKASRRAERLGVKLNDVVRQILAEGLADEPAENKMARPA